MESRCTFALKETAVIFTVAGILIVSLSTATGQSVDRCDPNSVKVCYAMYMTVLWREEFKPSPEGEYDEEELNRGCSENPAEIACFDKAFNSSCPLSMKTAKAAVTRVVNAASLLKGCKSSSNGVVVSRGFLLLLVVPVILSWLRT
ncbi:hypothetical protein HPB52_006372 [Rhipicephalus sanguineus]|uniref:Uncharacterized protein n=1 Tax=Rhipicephalus sanguineus TaxID=34632 RepID=A0A9D4QDN6_RHISA|nr:hypothetical protein HPB52_006372 [Rhipicephalus sanguineus]